jgi:Zn-dependent M28 family amino/carboxypeptidase
LTGLGRAAASAAPPSANDAERSERLQREALAGDGAFVLVRDLTTEIGNRFSGTPADRAAIAWCAARAKALGLPKVWTEPVTVPHWVRGGASGSIVTPWPQTMALLALGGSEGTPANGIEAEVVGVESVDALEKLPPEAVRGRIVFLSKRMRRTPEGTGYGETVPIRSHGPVVASRLGAAALLIRSVATDTNRLPHTGAIRWEEGTPRIPAAALSVPDAELLERELASGLPVRFRLVLGARMEGEADSANVLAEIPGTERPDEIVLLVAHRDSWDVGTGAQDNGTGVALTLEAARLIQAAGAPRRTVRVLLTANEEFGLSGARAYARAHASELSRHVLAIEMDSGAGRALRLLTRFAAADAVAAGELAARLGPLGVVPGAEPASGGADLIPVAPAGIPLVDLDQDRTRYFDIHHTENDTLDKIDPADLRQLAAALVTVADWAAQRPERLAPAPVPAETP